MVRFVLRVVWLIRHDGCCEVYLDGKIDGTNCSGNRCLDLKELLDLEAGGWKTKDGSRRRSKYEKMKKPFDTGSDEKDVMLW